MTPEQVLAIKPKVLTQAQRVSYFNDGFLLVERAIGEDWIRKLRAATDELVERSRKVTKSDPVFDLEPKHRPEAPRLRRGSNAVPQRPVFWAYCRKSVMAYIVAGLVGGLGMAPGANIGAVIAPLSVPFIAAAWGWKNFTVNQASRYVMIRFNSYKSIISELVLYGNLQQKTPADSTRHLPALPAPTSTPTSRDRRMPRRSIPPC